MSIESSLRTPRTFLCMFFGYLVILKVIRNVISIDFIIEFVFLTF